MKNPATTNVVNGVHNERRKWYLQESNRGHTDFQSDALPTELRHHLLFFDSSFREASSLICGCKGTTLIQNSIKNPKESFGC